MIDLTVKTLDSKNHGFSVPDDITVKQLKERIADSVNVSAESQRLIYCGRVLQDDKNLSEYDVNGKVIHLVQRPPPMPHSGGSNGGEAPRTNQPYSRVAGGNPRRRLFQAPGGRLDGGNAMYLGAMAFPADLMESQGLTMPQPRQCLSQSRLAVAKQMLRRASSTLHRLEHPNANNDSPPDSSPDSNGNINGDDPLPGSIAVAAQVATAAAFAAAVSAAQGSSVGEDEMRAEDLASGGVASAPATAGESGAASANSSQEQAQAQQPPAGTDEQSQNENGNGGRSRYPRTTAMAELLDTLADINRRLQPFLEQFHQTMREDPVLESPEETQRMFVRVSEVMHFLSHAYHALSDIMCDFSQPPPRYLRCRPVLIQHSAVVQTGIPIQAQINLTANALNQNQPSGQSQPQQPPQASGQANRDSSEATSDAATNGATATADTSSNGASAEQNGGAAAATGAAGAGAASSGAVGPNDGDRASRSQPTQGRTRLRAARSVNIGGPNFEFFMDVAPGSITIDSLEATVVTNANSNNGSEVNAVMGGFPWGSPPPAEFIQNLMQALTSQMMDGGANRQTTTASSTTSTSSTTQQPPTAQQAPNPPTATANSQARGNTATHPTTSTQTRSTSRPHVHLTPAAVQGLGASTFDPFLPCNSHHIRVTRRRNSQQQQQMATNQQQQPQQSQQTAQQTAQNPQQPQTSQQDASANAQTSQSNVGPQSTRRVQAVAPMPAPDRNLPNSTIDAAMNNFVTVVMNMANRNLGRWNVGPRTNSTATNTTGSGSTRTEGDNVTVTTQTPPIQVLPNAAAFLATNVGPNAAASIQQVPLPPGFPVAMLNHVISALSGGSPQIASPTSSTLSEFLQALPDFSYTPGDSIFMDLFMALAQSLTFVDMVNLGFGNADGLIRARPRLREFLHQRLLQNEPFSQTAAAQATGIINQELRTFLDNVISQRENRLREDIDLIATINRFNLHHLPMLMTTILEESDENFHRVLFRQCHEYINYFFAIMQYCCLDGAQGMENIIRGFVRQMTAGVPEQLQAWTVSSSVVNFRHYLSARTSQTNLSNIYQFIVFRAQPPSTQPPTPIAPSTEQQPPQLQQQQQPTPPQQINPPAEPMDTEPPSSIECVEEPVLAAAAAEITSAEPLPDVLLGSEDWHNSLPSDWVPIITRDSQRQRRQNPQPPFSDAYLSGMPSKRRKIITSAKPQGNLSQVISENMQSAVGAAGVTAPGVEIGVVAQGAGADPTLRLAYRDQIRTSVRQNLQSHPDYTPDKYPNAAKYFDTK